MSFFLSRLTLDSKAYNTLNLNTVEIFFQKSPGKDKGDKRGIKGLKYRVISKGLTTPERETGEDGRVEMHIQGDQATLQLLWEGKAVAEYIITISNADLAPETTLLGQQQRLRILGYQLGHAGNDQNGVDGNKQWETELSILDFQADHGLTINCINGEADQPTQAKLKTEVGW
ncbi:MAG: peptidoglycan-binding domain-containing protein [Thermodesulfobacteriota bacterium]